MCEPALIDDGVTTVGAARPPHARAATNLGADGERD
jgi:hypothetical protein